MPLLLILTALTLGFPAPPPPAVPIAFVHVTVVPMDADRVLLDQTVVVSGDRIVAMGPAAEVPVPAGARRIDGTGKYLMPGLAEMHAHIPPGAAPESEIERVLALYALHGVTTVRGMLGDPRHLPIRERAARGELLSPLIYTSGPSFNGQTVPTVTAARERVTEQKALGYDFLKIHPGIRREVFDSLAATATRLGIRFAGHVPLEVGLERAIALRYWSVDHLDGMVEALVPHAGAFTDQEDGFFGANLMDRVDESRLPALARAMVEAGVWVVPTETLMEHVLGDYPVEELRGRPEMRYMRPAELDGWVRGTTGWRQALPGPDQRRRYLALRRTMIVALHGAGVGFLLGSDAPQVWNVPGYSLRRELALLVEAGLTPFQALESGTRNVARFLGTETRSGTVASGKRADLILLDANPLTDVTNVDHQAGVMLAGRWLPRDEITRQLDGLAAR